TLYFSYETVSPPALPPFLVLFFLSTPPPPSSTLFPYTTLFRSPRLQQPARQGGTAGHSRHSLLRGGRPGQGAEGGPARRRAGPRSEEHTSELQSRVDLVCRLLLEKKKNKK